MLDAIVRYLHSSKVPFRLVSYPSDEPEPKVAHPLPPYALLVESHFVLVDGRLVLACCAAGDHIDLRVIGGELGGNAIEAAPEDLPEALLHAQSEERHRRGEPRSERRVRDSAHPRLHRRRR